MMPADREVLAYPGELVPKTLERRRAQLAGLTILEVHLLFRRPEPIVCMKISGSQPRYADIAWEYPFKAFQPADSATLRLPATLEFDVAYRLAAVGDSGPSSRPLWLRLARPYGMLGSLPWERGLGNALQRPVLRLPDYPDRPVERRGRLEHMIVVDPPSSTKGALVLERVSTLAEALLAGSASSAAMVHVFASARWQACLAGLASERIAVPSPTLAEHPALAMDAIRSKAWQRMCGAPWSNWVAATMEFRGVDAVHLLCRARSEGAKAQLLLSGRPWADEPDAPLCVIELDDLGLLLDRAGAWALSLLPPLAGHDPALATVADNIAHRRPGSVLYHPFAGRGDETMLRNFAHFMFSGGSAPALVLRDGFLYCHPSFVEGEAAQRTHVRRSHGKRRRTSADVAREAQPEELTLTQLELGIGSGAEAGDAAIPVDADASGAAALTPDWLGSTQRYLESAVLEQIRKQGPDVLLTSSISAHQSISAASAPAAASAVQTLYDIKNVVQDYLSRHGKE